MTYMEVPSDDQVVAALEKLRGHATALSLCNQLVADGHLRRESQLAIQRASERRRLIVNSDWTLSLVRTPEPVAA